MKPPHGKLLTLGSVWRLRKLSGSGGGPADQGARKGHGEEKEYSAHRNPEVRKRTPEEDADIYR